MVIRCLMSSYNIKSIKHCFTLSRFSLSVWHIPSTGLRLLKRTRERSNRSWLRRPEKWRFSRWNEKCLTRRYTTLLELEQHLRKENGKLKDDFTQMEAAVTERIGYLQRFKVLGLCISLKNKWRMMGFPRLCFDRLIGLANTLSPGFTDKA